MNLASAIRRWNDQGCLGNFRYLNLLLKRNKIRVGYPGIEFQDLIQQRDIGPVVIFLGQRENGISAFHGHNFLYAGFTFGRGLGSWKPEETAEASREPGLASAAGLGLTADMGSVFTLGDASDVGLASEIPSCPLLSKGAFTDSVAEALASSLLGVGSINSLLKKKGKRED